MSQFPLSKITAAQLRRLGEILWSWNLCDACINDKHCASIDCPSRRLKQLLRYFEYCRDILASYEPDIRSGECPALSNYEDLIDLITEIKSHSETSRDQLAATLFASRPKSGESPTADQQRAVNLAVKIMVMVNCSAQRQSSGLLEHGLH